MLCKRFAMLLLHLVKVTDTVLYVKEQERKGMRKHLSKVFTVVPQKNTCKPFTLWILGKESNYVLDTRPLPWGFRTTAKAMVYNTAL